MIRDWIEQRKDKKERKYIHFDINKKIPDLEKRITFFEGFFNDLNINKFSFKPFIKYEIKEKKLIKFEDEDPKDDCFKNNFFYNSKNKGATVYWHKEKIRPIMYAAHKDSDIYSYYSYLLGVKYREFLFEKKLNKNILAYRKIVEGESLNEESKGKGKSNIEFSLDIFNEIHSIDNCIVLAFDVSGFFDNLNHKILKKQVIDVLGGDKLSDEWYKIFKNLTQYCYIKQNDIDEMNLIKSYKEDREFPKVIDYIKLNKLKLRIKRKNNGKKLVHSNNDNKGIPQGTPISGMLANVYMSEFDGLLNNYCQKKGGKYYRYSDDLLLVIPCHKGKNDLDYINQISKFVLSMIEVKMKLKINNSKTEVNIFTNKVLTKNVIFDKKENKFIYKKELEIVPLQYLGFTYDGIRVLIRNQTLSKFYKKMILSLKRVSYLKDIRYEDSSVMFSTNYISGDKILLGKYNRKYLYNGIPQGKPYKKNNEGKYVLDEDVKGFYLGFLSYGYSAYKKFKPFCKKHKISNGIKNQLSGHRKKYFDLLKQYGIR